MKNKVISLFLIVMLLAFCLPVYAMENVSPWAKQYVEKAFEYEFIPKLMQEDGDCTKNITRAEMATVAFEVCAKAFYDTYGTQIDVFMPTFIMAPYMDSDFYNHPYYGGIRDASLTGLVNGVPSDSDMYTFLPDDYVTREQIATIMARVICLVAENPYSSFSVYPYHLRLIAEPDFTLPENANSLFADTSQISDYAKNSVLYLASENIINGVGDNLFAPKNYTTREEALTMAVRLYDFIMLHK